MRDDDAELTEADFARAIPGPVRQRLCQGDVRSGKDITALRRFVGMTQEAFARAAGMSVDTLQNWEQGCGRPQGPAAALIRIVGPRSARTATPPPAAFCGVNVAPTSGPKLAVAVKRRVGPFDASEGRRSGALARPMA